MHAAVGVKRYAGNCHSNRAHNDEILRRFLFFARRCFEAAQAGTRLVSALAALFFPLGERGDRDFLGHGRCLDRLYLGDHRE